MTLTTRLHRWLMSRQKRDAPKVPSLLLAWRRLQLRSDVQSPVKNMRHYLRTSHAVLGCGFGKGNKAQRRISRMERQFEDAQDTISDQLNQE